jgi:hypothetical protein
MKKVIVLIISVVVVFGVFSGCTEKNENSNNNNNVNPNENLDLGEFSLFNYPPINLEKIHFIVPLGNMAQIHVTPVDHQYYIPYDRESLDTEVYSPGDGIVTNINHMNIVLGDEAYEDDVRIWIQHSANVSSIYIHVVNLSDKLAAYDPGVGKQVDTNIHVSAGELIGYSKGIDYSVVDESVTLPFVNPSSYTPFEDFKIHIVDPFDYFNESVRSIMIGKCLRSVEPIGGKICYDIDGRLVGTWFKEGTNGYGGLDPNWYWVDHLVFAYDNIDPSVKVISFGTYIDSPKLFAVRVSNPDPANVTVGELVAYELVGYDYYVDGEQWDEQSYASGIKGVTKEDGDADGVLLVQLIENRLLKAELFPGKTADEVNGFTDNAKMYVR